MLAKNWASKSSSEPKFDDESYFINWNLTVYCEFLRVLSVIITMTALSFFFPQYMEFQLHDLSTTTILT